MGELLHEGRRGFHVQGLEWIADRSPVTSRIGDGDGEGVTDIEEKGGATNDDEDSARAYACEISVVHVHISPGGYIVVRIGGAHNQSSSVV